jgi:hypothetical protein
LQPYQKLLLNEPKMVKKNMIFGLIESNKTINYQDPTTFFSFYTV